MDYMLLQGGGKVGRREMIVTPDGPKWTARSYVKVRGLGVREVALFAIIFPPPQTRGGGLVGDNVTLGGGKHEKARDRRGR